MRPISHAMPRPLCCQPIYTYVFNPQPNQPTPSFLPYYHHHNHSPVKGVAWDPVGKYLASAGDDRALLVWRTADWGLEARITKPFQETAKQETMFRRIAWSPGGDTVVATNASVSKKCVA